MAEKEKEYDAEPVFDDGAKQARLTDAQKQELVAGLCANWNRWQEATQAYRDNVREAWQLYLENRPETEGFESADQEQDSRSRVRRPIVAEAVDAVLAQQHQSTYPADERFFEAIAKNEVSKQYEDLYAVYLEDTLESGNFLLNSANDRKSLMLSGISVVACPFIRKVRKRTVYDYEKVFGILPLDKYLKRKPKKKTVDVVEYEGTAFIPLSLEDWQIDPTVDDFCKTPIIWRRWECTYTLKNNEQFENREEITGYKAVRDQAITDKDTRMGYTGIQWTIASDQLNAISPDMALVYECWGDFVVDGEFFENHVLIISNDSTFHFFGPNPYDHGMKPFLIGPYNPTPGQIYGKSLAIDIIPLAHASDTMLNIMLDGSKIVAAPTHTLLSTDETLMAYFEEGLRPLRPGEIIPQKIPGSLQPIVHNTSGLNILSGVMQTIKEEVRESTGGLPYATGGISQQDQERTATETQALVGGTSSRFQQLNQVYEKTKLEPYLEMCFENDRQFMSEPKFIKGKVLTPDIVRQLDMKLTVTGSKSIMMRGKQINDLTDVLTGIVPALLDKGLAVAKKEPLEIDIPQMVRELATLKGLKNVEEKFKSIELPDEPETGGESTTNPEALNAILGQQQQIGAPNGFPTGIAGPPTDLGGEVGALSAFSQ